MGNRQILRDNQLSYIIEQLSSSGFNYFPVRFSSQLVQLLIEEFKKFRNLAFAADIINTVRSLSNELIHQERSGLLDQLKKKMLVKEKIEIVNSLQQVNKKFKTSIINQDDFEVKVRSNSLNKTFIDNLINVNNFYQDLQRLQAMVHFFEKITFFIKQVLQRRTLPRLVLLIFSRHLFQSKNQETFTIFKQIAHFIDGFSSFLRRYFRITQFIEKYPQAQLFQQSHNFQNFTTAVVWLHCKWVQSLEIPMPTSQSTGFIDQDQFIQFKKIRLRQKTDPILSNISLCPQYFVKDIIRLFQTIKEALSCLDSVDADIMNHAYQYVLTSDHIDIKQLNKGLTFAKHFWRGKKQGKFEYAWVSFIGSMIMVGRLKVKGRGKLQELQLQASEQTFRDQ